LNDNIKITKVSDLHVENKIFNLKKNAQKNKIEVSAISFKVNIHMNDKHDFFYDYVYKYFEDTFPSYTIWLYTDSGKLEDNRITRYKRLWKSSRFKNIDLEKFLYKSKDVKIEDKLDSKISYAGLLKINRQNFSIALDVIKGHYSKSMAMFALKVEK